MALWSPPGKPWAPSCFAPTWRHPEQGPQAKAWARVEGSKSFLASFVGDVEPGPPAARSRRRRECGAARTAGVGRTPRGVRHACRRPDGGSVAQRQDPRSHEKRDFSTEQLAKLKILHEQLAGAMQDSVNQAGGRP